MLKLVIIDSDEQSNSQPQSTIVEKETGDNEKEPVKDVSASIPELSTYIIQGGVFSSKEGAEETAKEIKSKGIPYSIIEIDGKHYLLLGVGDSLETAKVIVSKYKEDGVEDAFAKSLLIDKRNVSGMNETEQSFIESIPTIYQTIATATTSGFSSNTISEEAFKEMNSKEEQLKKSSIENEKIKKIQSELLSANEKVNAFHQSKDTKKLKEAEQHLLNFLSVYYSL
nr:SPOR domain-containing protein [Neobacillus thermocopriae]